jgi:uncharacterized protein
MEHFIHHFLHLLGESLPLFILGAAVGSALEIWMHRAWVDRWLAGGKGSVFLAACAGALLPGCAMSTMPLATSLRRRGVAIGTIATFIMIAPVLSPHTIALTAAIVSVPMAVARVLLAFVVACALGLILNATAKAAAVVVAESDKPGEKSCCCGSGEKKEAPAETAKARQWFARFIESLRELAPFLIGGLIVAALLMAYLPIENYKSEMSGGWKAYAVAVLIGIPAYVCDGGEIPLTRALLSLGVGNGPAFCFMLASVGTCFATIAMAGKIIGWRNTFIYLIAWLVLAVGGGIVVGELLG